MLFRSFLVVLPRSRVVGRLSPEDLRAMMVTTFHAGLGFNLVHVIRRGAVAVATRGRQGALMRQILGNAVAELIAIPRLMNFTTAIRLTNLFSRTRRIFIAARNLMFRFTLPIASVPLVNVVARRRFLVLIRCLWIGQELICPSARFENGGLMTNVLFIRVSNASVLRILVSSNGKEVVPLRAAIKEGPCACHELTARAWLCNEAIVWVRNRAPIIANVKDTISNTILYVHVC